MSDHFLNRPDSKRHSPYHRVTPVEQRRIHGYPGKVIDQVSRHRCRQNGSHGRRSRTGQDTAHGQSQGHHSNRAVTALLSLGGTARENQHGFVGTGVTARSPPSRRGHRRPGHASDRSGDGLLFPEATQTGRSRLCRRAVGPAWHIGGSQARQFGQSQIHHPHGPHTTAGGCHPYPLACRFVTAAGTDFPPFIPAIETVATRGRCRRPTPTARP